MAHTVQFLLFAAALGMLAVAASTPMTGCSGGGGGPTGVGLNLCSLISFGNNPARVSIQDPAGCGTSTGGFTNNQFDQFGRFTSFDFSFTCSSGDIRTFSGRVSNVTYNNLGEILSVQATINGRSCTLP